MKHSMAVITGLFAASIAAGEVMAQSEPPEIIAGRNGEAEVVFRNNCVVYYNARGRRTDSLPSCRDRQIHRADEALAAYRREQGHDGGGHTDHGRDDDRPPEIIAENGYVRIEFGNGCTVVYDNRGKRVKTQPACRDRQIRRADEAVAAYRREQGLDRGGNNGGRGDDGGPEVIMSGNGSSRVQFANKCIVYYDDRGRQQRILPVCRDGQIRQADQAIDAYRRERGY
jgi:hypothetical protein